MVHCVLFLAMGSLFAALYAKTAHDDGCDDKGCNFTKSGIDEAPTDYSVQSKFEAIFTFGIVTYFSDAVFRFIVVLGLKYN